MNDPYFSILGPLIVHVAGREVRPPPITTAVILRLLLADGRLVTVDELYRDVWGEPVRSTRRDQRVRVYKRISEIRRLLDTARPDAEKPFLLTEPGRHTGYRLVVTRQQVDASRFEDLVELAATAPPSRAAALLAEAMRLWRDRPLLDVVGSAFAGEAVRRLNALREQACLALADTYSAAGRADEARRLLHRWSVDVAIPVDSDTRCECEARLEQWLREAVRLGLRIGRCDCDGRAARAAAVP